jgi:hypothetical protein
MRRVRPFAIITLAMCYLAQGSAHAQYFGQNKVRPAELAFKVLETEHFAVYHDARADSAARMAARLAERWYARLSHVLAHDLDGLQPLVLYASQREFTQTHVISGMPGEGIGGVTESARRRIAMPLAPTWEETDHVLGHEIVHAFQFDIIRRHRSGLGLPRWAIEGMAQYLSLGSRDAWTEMWLRDATAHDLLPARADVAARRFSAYSYGHAFWAYVGGRFGEQALGDILRLRKPSKLDGRLKAVTGVTAADLYADWRAVVGDTRAPPEASDAGGASSLFAQHARGRVYLGPALSPDGRSAVFFSEEDRLSVDLFLTDTSTGTVRRKLATLAASPRLENLQSIRSSGSWSPRGDRFVFAAIDRGEPALVLVDTARPRAPHAIAFPQFGQILTPAWSPDGGRIAFAASRRGFTDLYVYDTEGGTLRQLTDDVYADLQPAWSPDGVEIAFATDRFSSDLRSLTFNECELAILNVASGDIRRVPVFPGARHVNPQWSADGGSLFFITDAQGTGNVYRLDLDARHLFQVTFERSGVAGVTATSPAISLAREAPVLAFSAYRGGRYDIRLLRGAATLEGRRVAALMAPLPPLPPETRKDARLDALLDDSLYGLSDGTVRETSSYAAKLSLESIGEPYLSSGGGPFGGFIRGGGSLLFGDMLGARKLATAVQVGNRLRDFALEARYLNREHRWTWGAVAELEPSLYGLHRRRVTQQDGQTALARETEYFQRMQLRVAGLTAYPLSRARRVEFTAGIRHAEYQRDVRASIASVATNRVLSRTHLQTSGGSPTTVAEAGVALVGDTSVWGPTAPLLGARYRFELSPTIGELRFARLLLDYRRYEMPVKPYTVAVRLLHTARYGRDADDARLVPTFLGSKYYVRGYGWSTRHCEWSENGRCGALEELLGSRVLVGNVELRFPLWGAAVRDIDYGRLPADGFLFADAGASWSRGLNLWGGVHRRISSVGAGVRVNVFGWPVELAGVRALNGPMRGWSFDVGFRQGF